MEKKQSKRERNKEQHKTAIMDAAEKLFIEKGFENTSIDDVAKEARLTKRTLYQYFVSKEDLFFAVALKGATMITANYEEALKQGNTALKKIHIANRIYLQFYKDYLGMFQILNYRPANQQNSAASPHYRQMLLLEANRMRHYVNLVEEGKSDSSINASLDIRKAVYFAFFTAFSLLSAVSTSDKSMWDMLGLDENEFLQFSFDMITNALK